MLLVLSCLVFSAGEQLAILSKPFLYLYYLAAMVLVLSVGYTLWLNQKKNLVVLAHIQIVVDLFCATAIIYFTGSYYSLFTFVYLVVIICSAMLLLRKGSLLAACISSVLYGLLIELDYYGIIEAPWNHSIASEDPVHVVYRIAITIAAFFAVALLSGILSTQLKTTRQDLKITQEHLKRVEKMEAMDELISGIVHEIKNPLASLSGSIQLLKEDAVPESYEDKLMKIILRETDRLKTIVNDIRVFAKPSRADSENVDIAQAIDEVMALFQNTPEWAPRIRVDLHLVRGLFVSINPIHLQQILWNLIKNAAEAIEHQGKITISLTPARNQKIYLILQDDGKGIDVTEARHIFDPFFTTKPEGTGLGLPIIHRLVHIYDGMIDFDSTPGKGTVFTLIFNQAAGPAGQGSRF